MRKKLIKGCIVVFLVFSICGCGQTTEDIPAAETATVETENPETESEEEADIENPEIEGGEEVDTEDTETEIAGDAEGAETNDSDESDTIYLKPCNTYQDILDNAYKVIVDGRSVDIVASDEVFSFIGIREALYGRDTDEALAGIGYMFYDVDGNGIEELIIADMLYDDGGPWDNRILLMYSLADNKPVLVIDYYSSGYYGDSEWGWFHSTTGETTEDESELIEFEDGNVPWKMQDDYMAQVKELDLTFF